MEHLTDHELLRAWHHTSQRLTQDLTPSGRVAVVRTRQYLLDEMWTRDKRPADAWIGPGM